MPPIIWFSGLMRCCTTTVELIIEKREAHPVGTIIDCSYHPRPSQIIGRADGWHWLKMSER